MRSERVKGLKTEVERLIILCWENVANYVAY